MKKIKLFIFVELVVIAYLCMQILCIVFAAPAEQEETIETMPTPVVVLAAEEISEVVETSAPETIVVEETTAEQETETAVIETVAETEGPAAEETVVETVEESSFGLYNDHLASYGFGREKQEWLYNLAKERFPSDPDHYYTYIIAVMEKESTIGKNKYHRNSNGSVDLGIMQVNSCNWGSLKKAGIISSSDDLYDDYVGIIAGCYMLDPCIAKWGISQNAYYSYNTGRMKTRGTNKNSAKVWEYYGKWNSRILEE